MPERPFPHEHDADAVVPAPKSRTAPRQEAITASLAALHHLIALGCERVWFKYCSTFDSVPQGNIGPVTEALLDALGERCTVLCAACPDNGRTVYRGHLFVDDTLPSDSAMRHHPLTPMTDSDVRRTLAAHSTQPVDARRPHSADPLRGARRPGPGRPCSRRLTNYWISSTT
ncbi:four-carbon acid sugar kinase family protein [Streptomyces cynarae]|uniref:Four-carbon acid sugar kinase family protein n=1 Tax=Streptomyces cynarae TaxID=2981134 RepID=A0ABY6DVJ9_9ACTN|nr:four-carbon acid sugar kinase family protein [Streptomyces cynarae]UXY17546.1 four-carbon acid sugar kinase family protein [Streptomyces cynarae]